MDTQNCSFTDTQCSFLFTWSEVEIFLYSFQILEYRTRLNLVDLFTHTHTHIQRKIQWPWHTEKIFITHVQLLNTIKSHSDWAYMLVTSTNGVISIVLSHSLSLLSLSHTHTHTHTQSCSFVTSCVYISVSANENISFRPEIHSTQVCERKRFRLHVVAFWNVSDLRCILRNILA